MFKLRTYLFIFLLLVLAVLLGYNYYQTPFLKKFEQIQKKEKEIAQLAQQTPTPSPDPVQTVFAKLDALQKIGQLIAWPVKLQKEPSSADQPNLDLAGNNPGVIALFGQKITREQVADFLETEVFTQNQVPPLLAVDHEGGLVQRLSGEGFTHLPSWQQSCEQTASQSAQLFNQSAQELAEAGVNIIFAPVLDLADSNPVLRTRTCGDLEQLLATTDQFLASFSTQGIMPVVKHYPGIGQIDQDLHTGADRVEPDPDQIKAFTQVLDKYSNIGVMTTHVQIQDKFEQSPCSLNSDCLAVFAQIYPQVLVFSDDLAMKSALNHARINSTQEPKLTVQLVNVAQQAILAGNHVLIFGPSVTDSQLAEVAKQLAQKYDQDPVLKKQVDQAVLRILKLKKLQ